MAERQDAGNELVELKRVTGCDPELEYSSGRCIMCAFERDLGELR